MPRKPKEPESQNLKEPAKGLYGGFDTLLEYHKHQRAYYGAGYIECPFTKQLIPQTFN